MMNVVNDGFAELPLHPLVYTVGAAAVAAGIYRVFKGGHGEEKAPEPRALMDPGTTILRVKRKRGTDPADALLLACKRVRAESGSAQPEPEHEHENACIENSVFKLVATVASQDAPVQTHVREALSRPRLIHALRPSHGSSSRILRNLRNAKWSTRREERYRIMSSHRAGPLAEPLEEQEPKDNAQTDAEPCLGDVQVYDIIQESIKEDEKDPDESNPETIVCNSVKMIREKLNLSKHGIGSEHREKDDDYVYDLYYQETATPGWIQDILSVRVYADEGELVPDEVTWEEEVYEDEDDENAESNWRNDYPDEEDSEDEVNEERYGGCWSEEHAYSRRSWERYRREVMEEEEEDDREEYDFD